MNVDLTHGSIFRGLLRFSLPLMAGNLLQQLYNLVDTFVVGRYCGEIALAAVGSAFSVMILLTSIVTGLCMGSGAAVSMQYAAWLSASFSGRKTMPACAKRSAMRLC